MRRAGRGGVEEGGGEEGGEEGGGEGDGWARWSCWVEERIVEGSGKEEDPGGRKESEAGLRSREEGHETWKDFQRGCTEGLRGEWILIVYVVVAWLRDWMENGTGHVDTFDVTGLG